MAFTLYDLVLSGLLFVNALCVINERFIIQLEKLLGYSAAPSYDGSFSFPQRVLHYLNPESKRIFHMPLIWCNVFFCIIELFP
jgi:hypothetical protein